MDVKVLDDEPLVSERNEILLELFLLLDEGRSYGMDANPISIEEIVAGLDLYLVEDVEDRINYVFMIRHLDSFYRKLMRDANDKGSSRSPTSKAGGGPGIDVNRQDNPKFQEGRGGSQKA